MKQEKSILNVPVTNELELKTENGAVVVSSRVVAERFEKRHSDVIEKINKLIEEMDSTEKSVQYFIASKYKDGSGKSNKEYLLTRDGFTLLAMGFTGKEALKWKLKYIEAFNQMEKALKEQSNPYGHLSKEVQAIFALDVKQQELDNRISKLEDTMTIDYSKQEILRSLIAQKVVSLLGGSDSTAYRNAKVSGKGFRELHRAIHKAFQVNSYKNIAHKDFDEAKGFVIRWQASEELQLMILGANAQMRL